MLNMKWMRLDDVLIECTWTLPAFLLDTKEKKNTRIGSDLLKYNENKLNEIL